MTGQKHGKGHFYLVNEICYRCSQLFHDYKMTALQAEARAMGFQGQPAGGPSPASRWPVPRPVLHLAGYTSMLSPGHLLAHFNREEFTVTSGA